MAAPHMAGVVALMKAIEPGLTPDTLDTLISSGAITQDTGGDGPTVRNDDFGYGLIDALKAVEAATNLVSGTLPAIVSANPSLLDFGNTSTTLNFTLTNSGGGSPTITSIVDNASWLNGAAISVDGAGFGTYTAIVNRAGLVNATYSATILVSTSTAGNIQIPVTMIVGATPSSTNSDAGFHYIILVDPDSGGTLAQTTAAANNGVYQYQFNNIVPGNYHIVAGTDLDNDDFICDAGEACGVYPTRGLPGIVEVSNGNLTGMDFVTGFNAGLGASSASDISPVSPKYQRIPDKHKKAPLP